MYQATLPLYLVFHPFQFFSEVTFVEIKFDSSNDLMT
jgi:hypothetical protein